ncbi:hypothetical protein [Lichenicoccus sp.]|uniref:hypothetical protein n=1 Tax=Lichenicoccus sp. TaxID=2781899 RepID=UPI003D12F852
MLPLPMAAILVWIAGPAWAAAILLGLGALLSPWPAVTLGLLLLGYVSIAILDPLAARRHETPAFFARLRPFQMPIAIAGLAVLIVRLFLPPH